MAKTRSEFYLGKRYQLFLLGGVAIFTIVSANIAWLFPTRDELQTDAYLYHRSAAIDVRNQLNFFIDHSEKSMIDAVDIINQKKSDNSQTVSRIMKENQPFESVTLLGLDGKEVFKNHRFLLVTKSDFRDRSGEDLFASIKNNKPYFGPVVISSYSEPIITLAYPLNEETNLSAFVVELNLKSFLGVVRNIDITNGATYVVDQNGYIIVHPNASLVFGRINIANRKIVLKALSGSEVDTRDSKYTYKNENSDDMFAVAIPVGFANWAIFAESPAKDALASSQRVVNVAVISFVLETLLVILLIWNYSNLVSTAGSFYGERNQREAILNSLYDGVIEYDQNFKITLMNPKAEDLMGVKLKEIEGLMITTDLIKSKPNLKALVEVMYPTLAPYASASKELQGSNAKIMEIHTSQPELRLIVTFSQVVTPESNSRNFLKILHDVSREKLIGKLKSEFVSIAAHQLRTPLSAMKWTLKLLIDGDAGSLSAAQLSFLQRGYEVNERMIRLVNDLLNAARIEEGRFGYEFKEMDLELFIADLFSDYKSAAESKSINYELDKPTEKIPKIYADAEKLELALSNLIDNALKYTPPHGQVKLKYSMKGDYIEFSVSDTGLGIPEVDKERLFTKFFRASNVMRMETEGTGLGLFIAKNIIKRHGGSIAIESQEGRGTRITISLPLRREFIPSQELPEVEQFLETI